MLQYTKEFFLSLSFPAKILAAGVAIIALSWVPMLMCPVFVYSLLGVKDGNPIGLGLLMMLGSMAWLNSSIMSFKERKQNVKT